MFCVSILPVSATRNVSTFRATEEEIKRLESALSLTGLASRSHFFRLMTMAFIAQVESGARPEWPPQFMARTGSQKKGGESAPPKKPRKP